MQTYASTDVDIRNDRRRNTQRPTQKYATVVADPYGTSYHNYVSNNNKGQYQVII